MSKFLDETGLAYFWNKIKAALSTVAFTGSYNDLSNKPNIPAGSTVDTALSSTSENPVQNKVINTALGNKANNSDVVHTTGNETIDGHKDFKQSIRFCSDIAFVNQSFVKGTAPSSAKNTAIYFTDKIENLTPGVNIPAEHRTAIIRQFYGTAGNNALQFFVYYPSSANNSYFYLTLNTNADGSSIYFAPSISEVCSLGLTNNRWSSVYTQYVDATQYQGTQAALNLSTTFTSAKEYWPFIITRNSADTTNSSGSLMQLGVQQLATAQNFRIQLRVANPRGGNLPSSTISGASTGNCWGSVGVLYDYNLNRTYPECLNCTSWDVSDNSASHLASTAWVRAATGNTALNAATATRMLINDYDGDLDDLKTSGFYYAESGDVTNLPVGTNGQIIVIDKGSFKRQFFMRSGTPGTNDHQIYSREYSDTNQTWGPWFYFLTSKHLPLSVANGGTGLTSLDTFVRTTGNQTIADFKVFTDSVRCTGPSFCNINQNIVKGTIPSSNQYRNVYFFDKVDDPYATSLDTAHVMASIRSLYAKTSGNNSLQLIVYTPTTGGTANKLLSFRATPAGAYAFLPGTDNDIDLGGSSNRWANVYATTFIGGVIKKDTTSTSPIIQTETDAGALRMWGGATSGKGGYLVLCGKDYSTDPGDFYLAARDATNSVSLHGQPNGTLTWNDKYFVYTSTDQNVGGVKTFTSSPAIKRVNPYLDFVETDWEKGGTVTATQYMGVRYNDKNNSLAAALFFHYYEPKIGALEFRINDTRASDATGTSSLYFSYTTDGVPLFRPDGSGKVLLGTSSNKWNEIWCTQSSINTSSDERIKQQIANVPDAVLDAWGDVDWIQFKYNDSVAEKGTDKARLHNGLIAQRVDAAFKAHGLDASKYGLFLYDTWDAQPEERDDDGTLIHEAQPAGDGYGLRYTEALCMEAAYQRRRANRAEARISALEQRLNELEEVLMILGDRSNES